MDIEEDRSECDQAADFADNHPQGQYRRRPVVVSSFGFKNGTPGADCVLNARKVKNPGHEFRQATGVNKKVRQRVFEDAKAAALVTQGVRVVDDNVQKTELTEGQETDEEEAPPFHLAIGCERGRHRSVSIAIEIGKELQTKGYDVTVVHRDI